MYKIIQTTVFVLLSIFLTGSLVLTMQTAVRGQEDAALFNITSIERSVTLRFKLSKNDRQIVHAAIERENRVLVLSYLRFSESNTDFLCLWNKVRLERHEAEINPEIASLSPRQRSALAKARDEVERRVLEAWLNDYLSGLTDLLELDRIQADCISKVFERESETRRRLLAKESREGIILNAEWDKITEERDKCLRSILDPLQLHDYNLLFTVNNLIA